MSFSPRSMMLVTALLTYLMATSVWAHARPVTRTPTDHALVSAPHEVRIDFSETLEPALSSILVIDAQGKTANNAKSAVDSKNAKLMSVALPPLPAGVYQVKWVAVATDGHRTQGQYTFTVK